MKKFYIYFVPVLALFVALAGLFLPPQYTAVEPRGSTERVGQITFITSDMDPVIQMGNLNNRIDFDADGDSSIRASADDTIDFEVTGEDDFQITDNTFTLCDGTADDCDIVFDGSAKDFYISLDDGTDDLYIGHGSTVGTDVALSIDEDAVLTIADGQWLSFNDTPVAGSGGSMMQITDSLTIQNGSDSTKIIDMDITNANHTGASNEVIGMEIDLGTPDAQSTEIGLVFVASKMDMAIDLSGLAMDLDADNDTSIAADSDDQIDFEIEGADVFVMKDFPGADAAATTNLLEIIDTAPADTTGSNTHQGLVIDLEGANATGGTNVLNAFVIDALGSADAQITETAIKVGASWDTWLNINDDYVMTPAASADSAATNEGFEIALTSPADTTGTNTHNAFTVDLDIGNATGGTNSVRAINIDNITGDPQVTETAIEIGSGFAQEINSITDLNLFIDDTEVIAIMDPASADSATTNNLVEILGTTPVDTTGTQTHNFLNIDAAIGASSGGTNTVNAIAIDNISASGNVTEVGISLEGTGWDIGISLGGNQLDLDADDDTSITADSDDQIDFEIEGADVIVMRDFPAADAGVTTNLLEIIDTGLADTTGTNTHQGLVIDLESANATGGTNALNAIVIDTLGSADAQVTETAFKIGDSWDVDIDATTDLDLAVDATTIITAMDPASADSATTNNVFEILGSTPADTTGTQTHNFLTLDVALGNSTGGANKAIGLQIDGITDDDYVSSTAIRIGDEWDYALDTAAPIVATANMMWEDFLGDTVEPKWDYDSGSGASDPDLDASVQYGVLKGSTPGTDTDFATDHVGFDAGAVHWQADQGNLVFEARFYADSIADISMCVGLTDTETMEMPASISGTTVTTTASDMVAFCFDDDQDTDEWYMIGCAGDTDATGIAALGTAPTTSDYQVLRIEVDSGGSIAHFYIDGTHAGTLTANVVTVTDKLTPVVVVDNEAASAKNFYLDYILVSADRD